MQYLSTLMYRTKEYGTTQSEILAKCSKYFGIIIPRLHKNDIQSFVKSKEFMS